MITDVMTKNIFTIINIIATALIIFLGVNTFYRVIEARFEKPLVKQRAEAVKAAPPKSIATPGLSAYEVINRRSIFGRAGAGLTGKIDDISQVENLNPTSLDVILLGTVAGSDEDAYAIIEDKSKRTQDIYHIGDNIKGAILKNIYRNKVVIRFNGKDEILLKDENQGQKGAASGPFPGFSGMTPPPGTGGDPVQTIMLNRAELETALSNIQEVMTQASIQPHMQDGVVDGMTITSVKAGSIFRKAGLRSGDIIKGIEGREIKNPEDLLSIYGSLRDSESVGYQIIRRGRVRNIQIRVR
ncbi:MAG: PDZ domain-containing protein [Desulfatiglans sp.]|jgi:general secretion pathway protein C|nr:PDZ domain-containing protein [Desulfatiglans sp.]